MYNEPVDYTPAEVHNLRVFFEQFASFERNYQEPLMKILAIIRGVDDTKLGTGFITERMPKQ